MKNGKNVSVPSKEIETIKNGKNIDLDYVFLIIPIRRTMKLKFFKQIDIQSKENDGSGNCF